MTTDIVNQIINQYTGSIGSLQAGSIVLGKELFNSIALISIALLGLNHLLKSNIDLAEANMELIRWLIYLDFFYAFIINFPSIYAFVYAAIQQIGTYLGTQAAGKAVDISPANIFHIGIGLALKILGSNITLNLFRNLLYPLVSVLSAVMILFCFAAIGVEMILVQIGSQIILVGGIFLLAFSGFQWTRDYAERYVHTFFHLGIKMVFMYILVGLGISLAQGWSQVVVNAAWNKVIDYDIAVCLSTYIYYKLCMKVPDQAVSWLTGRLAMGFDTATDVKGAGKKVVAAVAGTAGLVHGVAGMSKAAGAAMQASKITLAQKGKAANAWNMANETVKTLGAAWRKETWDKKVDASIGGKMEKDILEIIDPKKTKKDTKPDDNVDPDNDSMDPSI